MKIELSKYYLKKCEKFADQQLDTSFDCYSYRGESRREKMRDDVVVGKLGEVAAMKYLHHLGYECNKPDFTIYERRRKSFSADLQTHCGLDVHVKSQSTQSRKRYGASWLLQKTDRLVNNPDPHEFILMVCLDGLEADIIGVVAATDLKLKKLFESPRVPRYARTKYALYFDNIERSGIDLNSIKEVK